MQTPNEYSQKVITLIKSIPKGQVATYGLLAKLAGKPRGAREIGWLLHSSTQKYKLPWQRVIKSNGQLSFPTLSNKYILQKNLLEKEGVIVQNGRVNLKKYLIDHRSS